MRLTLMLTLTALVAVMGCAKPASVGPVNDEDPPANASLLQPFLAKDKLGEARAVIDVRDKANDGDEVVFRGTVPPENVKPFNDTFAVFRLMDPRDLDDPQIKEEFDCKEAAT